MKTEWESRKVSDLCDLIVDCVNKTAPVSELPTPYKMIRTSHIKNGFIKLTDEKCVDQETFEKWTRRAKLQRGDVLLTREAPLGSIAMIRDEENHFLGQRIMQYRTNEQLMVSEFLLYSFLSPMLQYQFASYGGTGSTVDHIRVPDCSNFEVPVPPLADQKAIAHILGTLDDKIELNQKMNQTLEEIAKAIFKSWFVDFDPVRAKAEGRPTGLPPEISDLFPDELVESEIGEIPKGWGLRRLDSLLELAYGKSLPAKNRLDGEVPVYGSGGVNGFHNEPLVEGTSIVVGRKGTVGSLYWVDKPFFPIDTVFYVRTEESIHYCFYLMQTLRLDTMNTDAAVPGLNRDNAYRLEFPNAPTPLVNHFSEIAKSTRDRISIAEEESKVLSDLRDTLLPKLISGELRIPDAEKFLEEAGI